MSGFEVDQMRAAERSAAVVTLARAFHDDPLFNVLVPDLLSQARALLRFMGSLVNDASHAGEVWVARQEGRVLGAAVWLPPDGYPLGARRETLSYLRDLPSVPRFGRRLPTAVRLQTMLQRKHHEVRELHWYLSLLGTDPGSQRRGVGTALLAPLLERCDDQGFPIYLETQKEANVPWYGRHGFGLVEALTEPGCPPMWTMRRAPR